MKRLLTILALSATLLPSFAFAAAQFRFEPVSTSLPLNFSQVRIADIGDWTNNTTVLWYIVGAKSTEYQNDFFGSGGTFYAGDTLDSGNLLGQNYSCDDFDHGLSHPCTIGVLSSETDDLIGNCSQHTLAYCQNLFPNAKLSTFTIGATPLFSASVGSVFSGIGEWSGGLFEELGAGGFAELIVGLAVGGLILSALIRAAVRGTKKVTGGGRTDAAAMRYYAHRRYMRSTDDRSSRGDYLHQGR